MRPLEKYLLTNSPVPRHATTSIQSVTRSPVFLSLKSRSTARVKLATGVPVWVWRSSGSRDRRPMITMWFRLIDHHPSCLVHHAPSIVCMLVNLPSCPR
ncbi:MAG: hypothetical protein [Caudoviricetes sp.]|nr:MAG: hypothetical protein [Caudoviricetes sp.]